MYIYDAPKYETWYLFGKEKKSKALVFVRDREHVHLIMIMA